MTRQLSYSVRSEESQFGQIYRIIAEAVGSVGIIGDQKYRFAVCVSEAFTNAFYHGNQADPAKSVKLQFVWNESELEFTIEDEGHGHIAELDLTTELKDIDPQKTSGRGLAIMRGYADRIDIEEKVDGGLRFKMLWRLHALAEAADRS